MDVLLLKVRPHTTRGMYTVGVMVDFLPALLEAAKGEKRGRLKIFLGAAPGGWSYSAAKRGARVVAVDNGPLKGGALGHASIEHRREDAFRFGPAEGAVFDWLFCDMVEEPHHVLRDIVEPWLARGWCRRLVVNLKFGRVDPVGLLRELRASGSPFTRRVPSLRVSHLFHDREEFTLVGEVAPAAGCKVWTASAWAMSILPVDRELTSRRGSSPARRRRRASRPRCVVSGNVSTTVSRLFCTLPTVIGSKSYRSGLISRPSIAC